MSSLLRDLVESMDPSKRRAPLTLKEFMLQGWHVLEPGTRFVDNWHIDAICEHLEGVSYGHIRKLLVNMPPRCEKSLLVSVFWPMWEWVTWPERRFLYSSYAQSLSTRDSRKCRRLIESPWYQRNWGKVFQLTSDANNQERFENDRSGYRIATSVGGPATGEGGDRIVCDDPHKVGTVESDTVRKSALEWWDQEMSTRVNDPKTGAHVVVMQRIHEQDLSGHVLQQGGYLHLKLPMRWEGAPYVSGWTPPGADGPRTDPRTVEGELLWPERFDTAAVTDLETRLGSYGASGQLQQEPAPLEGGIFKRVWWQYWRPADRPMPPVTVRHPDGRIEQREAVPLPEVFDQLAQSWDCTFKDTKASDFVCGHVWAGKGADRFLLHQALDRMAFPATCDAIRTTRLLFPEAGTVLIEDKANGPAVIATLKSEVSGLIAVEPEGGKEARAHAVSPQVESGNVYLPHPDLYPWVDPFINTCALFPKAKHDDPVDAMTQALLRMHLAGRGVFRCVTMPGRAIASSLTREAGGRRMVGGFRGSVRSSRSW